MAGGFFTDRAVIPDDAALSTLLEDAMDPWRHIEQEAVGGTTTAEWKYYTKKTGWVRVIRRGKRTLFYMIPDARAFGVSFVFGERAVQAVMESDVNAALKERLANATPYMEGRGLDMEVHAGGDLADFQRLLAIKQAK